jgi:DNA polymerase-3 subunit alpha
MAREVAGTYRGLFGPERFWIELQHHLLPEDDRLVYRSVALAKRLGLGYVATNDVHYATRAEHRPQDVLVCIRHGLTLDDSAAVRRPNSEYYLKGAAQMLARFADYPEAVEQTRAIAARCSFRPACGLQDLPVFSTPEGLDALTYLRQLCESALPARLPEESDQARALLDHELAIIGRVPPEHTTDNS